MWLYGALASAVLLGIYDILRKHALQRNAVIPVLFLSTFCGSLMWAPFLVISTVAPSVLAGTPLLVPPADWVAHGRFFIKAVLVAGSWVLVYFAMKHLPISIASPIRASAPLWTLFGAVAFMGERPTGIQFVGVAVTLAAYLSFSFVGRQEGIRFERNRWIGFVVAGTIVGSVCALYDKYLLHIYPASLVQPWFSFYLVVVMIPLLAVWSRTRARTTPLQWRWSIALTGVFLILSDFVYMHALNDPDALIAVVSTVRRSNVVLSFGVGALLFGDVNRRKKGLCLIGVLVGLAILLLGRR